MGTVQGAASYEVTEVRTEQWLLAALRLQDGLRLTARRGTCAPRRRAAPARASTRGSLWVMLGVSCLGLCLL